MRSQFFDVDKLKTSPYPANVVPAGARVITGFDKADGTDTTVKGFYLNGEYHIQEITKNHIGV